MGGRVEPFVDEGNDGVGNFPEEVDGAADGGCEVFWGFWDTAD